jgi:hypothetical protein
VGKTTIADAILWCLFGKNSAGQSDFDLKTHDEDGKPIPNLDHSVEMEISVYSDSGLFNKGINLKRTLKETWIKKRGSDEQVFKNNTTEYLVDGDSYTAADYKKFIAELVNEDIFKAITNPTYFPSLKWQQQREFLTKMVGSIEPEVIADTDELVELVHLLDNSNDDIIAYRKHLSYQIKKIKEALDKIPVRLEEQNKALPESLDYEALQMELEKAKNELKQVDEKIVAVKSGNGGDVLRAELREKLENVYRDLSKIEDVERKAYSLRKQEHDNNVSELSRKFSQAITDQRLMEQTIEADGRFIERCKGTIDDCDKELQKLRDNWPNRKFEVDPNAAFCPTCGQPLPDELASDRIKSMRDKFNKALEEEKQTLREKAAKVKQTKEDAERELASHQDKLKFDTDALAKMKEEINIIFSNKAKLEKETVLSVEHELAECKQYQELLLSKEELQKKLDSVGVSDEDTKAIDDLNAMKCALTEGIQTTTAQLATREMRLKILSLIDGINEEQKDLVRQLSELERKEDVARRYQDRQNAILEERINEHFSLVKWRMFRTVNNGGDPFDEPYCECYVDGVAYHDGLNQAARLNAGLDIINALCKHYNVSAPIVLDNAESTINIIKTIGQQIRLEVADTELQVV